MAVGSGPAPGLESWVTSSPHSWACASGSMEAPEAMAGPLSEPGPAHGCPDRDWLPRTGCRSEAVVTTLTTDRTEAESPHRDTHIRGRKRRLGSDVGAHLPNARPHRSPCLLCSGRQPVGRRLPGPPPPSRSQAVHADRKAVTRSQEPAHWAGTRTARGREEARRPLPSVGYVLGKLV